MSIKKKTIVYLRTDIYAKDLVAGGSVSHTIGTIQGFLGNNYKITCITTCLFEQLDGIAIQVIPLVMPAWLRSVGWKCMSLFSTLFFLPTVLKVLKYSKPDFMYQRYSPLNCTGAFVSIFKKIPLILEFNGSEYWVQKNWSRSTRFQLLWLFKVTEKFNLLYAHTIVVVSDVLREQLIEQGYKANKIITIPNGVNIQEYNPATLTQERDHYRALLRYDKHIVFGFVGTFNQWHGITILQDIIPRLIALNTTIRFLLIGDGPLCATLKESIKGAQLQEYVFFTGMQPQKQARAYLAACDVFLAPTQPNADGSPFFGSPTKFFEYLSLAKPIIASNLGQIAAILKPALYRQHIEQDAHLVTNVENNVGILIDSHDSNGFVQACYFVSTLAPAIRAQMGENAQKRAQQYDWTLLIKQLCTTLQT